MSGGAARAARWVIPRSDVPASALALTRLAHPLLPELSWMRFEPRGVAVGPVRAPLAFPVGEPGPFLVLLAGLAAFLHAQGLGVAPGDASLLGQDGEGHPSLGAPPAPAWRSLPPALLVAGIAARLAGARLPEGDVAAWRAALERLPARTADGAVRRALRAEAAGQPPEALVAELWKELAPGAGLGRDLLGFVMPHLPLPDDGRAAAAWGPDALFLARAAARDGEGSFVESGAGAVLEEGGAIARLGAALAPDPRAAGFAALARGERAALPDGPPLALLAREFDRWDARSRAAWDDALAGLARVEARVAPPEPWERRHPLALRVDVSAAAAVVWLPLASLAESVGLWERLARAADGDLARLLALARRAASALRPGEAPRLPAPARSRRTPPALVAASFLLDGFDSAELAVAADVAREEAEQAIGEGVADGLLVASAPGAFRFTSEEVRRRLAALPGRGARAALARRAAAGLAEGERLTAALLARGDPADVARAGALLARAVDEEREALALALLDRAPVAPAGLGDPLRALVALARDARREAADAMAPFVGDGAGVPLPLRAEAARALVRLGRTDAALALVADDGARLARARVLVDARRPEEASRVMAATGAPTPSASERVERWLLAAEIAERGGRYAEAGGALRRAARLLSRLPAGAAPPDAARTAGFLASDLGRTDEALAFFRRARDEARRPEARADALADLAVCAHHAGRLSEAMRFTEEALASFAALADRGRWISTLGNRADLLVTRGDVAGARRDLDAVLAHDREPGREHQLLFALPTLQRLLLADGDLEGASRAFGEAESARQPATHPAWREALLLEARRLLMGRRPREAEELLARAGALADNRWTNEPLRARLLASAALDAGDAPDRGALDPAERALLDAEASLLRGTGERATRAALEPLAKRPGGALLVAERVVEWALRFPRGLARQADLVRAGRRAAARAGLSGAEELLGALDRRAPAPVAEAAPAPGLAPPLPFVADDPAMRALLAIADRVGPTLLPVLVLGESGTGKELLARRLHDASRRRGPLVAVNVAALAPTLVESELFGHAKGAFTGADRERTGLVEASSGGTLFLDEIGDLPLALQGKLLRVLQERELVRVGETRPRKVDLRVVAATHRPLAAMAREGTFRFDLHQRLAGVTLELPPLRERPRDLAALVARALGGAAITPEARRLLLAHSWPGNVRELLAAVEAARVLAGEEPIGPGHLPASLRKDVGPAAPRSYRDALRATRRRSITEALESCGGNRTHAAKLLGLSRQSLLYEIRKLGL